MWPLEGKIALAVVPLSLLVVTHGLSMLPVVGDALLQEELSAAGTIMAIMSALLIQFTFGGVAKKRLREARERRDQLPMTIEADLFSGPAVAPLRQDTTIQALAALQRRDPSFSAPLLAVFSRALVARVADANDQAAQHALAPYIAKRPLDRVRAQIGEVDHVLAGPARILSVDEQSAWTVLTVEQPVLAAHGGNITRVEIVWELRRTSAARSPSPVDLVSFTCPACGAPVETTHPDGQCTTCQTGITHGQRSWQVVEARGRADAPPWPEGAVGGGAHASILAPTLEDPALEAALRTMHTRHPEVALADLEKRAAKAALAWFEGLVSGDMARVKALFSSDLTAAYRYEVGRLRAGRLSARGGPGKVSKVEWSRAGPDGWHETADLRVFLSMPWCVQDSEGRVVDGDPETARALSVVVRMIHPTAATSTLEGWRAWQILDAREYCQ